LVAIFIHYWPIDVITGEIHIKVIEWAGIKELIIVFSSDQTNDSILEIARYGN